MHIGIDFGTTNSVLAYVENQELSLYSPPGSEGHPYIPSVLIKDPENDAHDAIGVAAKALRNSIRTLRQGFKLLIGSDRDETRHEHNEDAKRFLAGIIKTFKHDMLQSDIRNLVLTAPEAWWREDRHDAREALINMCSELSLSLKRVISEPVAAAGYFAHKYREKHGQDYNGHLLVYDHGGGTLDLCLVEIKGTEIHSKNGYGLANEVYEKGFGGVTYDHMVMQHLKDADPNWDRVISADKFEWLETFEKSKRSLGQEIDRMIPDYRKFGADREVFEVKGVPITISVLCDVFDLKFKDHIIDSIKAFEPEIQKTLDENLNEDFQLLMVGGFSCYKLVRDLVYEQVGKLVPSDQSLFNREDSAFAIAKGAALYAANDISIYETCPITIGVIGYDKKDTREKYNPLVTRGYITEKLKDVKFCDVTFSLSPGSPQWREQEITFYTEDMKGKHEFKRDITLAKALPDFDAGGKWRIGARIENNMAIVIVFKRIKCGSEIETPLGEILALTCPSAN